jgi:hypothetical protein
MAQVLDYSAGFPGAAAIRDAGYPGAVRYGGFPGRRKCTTAAELRDFDAHGLGMAIVFEDTETTWRGGYGAGQSAAQRTRNHLDDIGFPQNRPIYMAIDQDVVTGVQFDVMVDFLRGAASVVGSHLIGPYGEADVIDRARGAGLAAWSWQTPAWSGGRRTDATLYQRLDKVYVGGVQCDVSDVLQEDWGQHNRSKPHGEDDDTMFIECADRGSQAILSGGILIYLDATSAGGVNPGDRWPRVQVTAAVYDSMVENTKALLSIPAKLDALQAALDARTGNGGPEAV